jgi:hypothetical protein
MIIVHKKKYRDDCTIPVPHSAAVSLDCHLQEL